MALALSAERVSVSFEGLRALSNVSVDVPREMVTGLIGPNGAGKTTLVNVLTGFQVPTEGAGQAGRRGARPIYRRHKIAGAAWRGLSNRGACSRELSVLDNLEVTGVGLGLARHDACAKAQAMLEWIGIAHLAERAGGGLPYTDERRVAIGRALMMEPNYLLLDEPAAGMSAEEARGTARPSSSRIVAEKKCGVLLIEHNIGLVLNICDHIHVLDSGEIIEDRAACSHQGEREGPARLYGHPG